MLYKHRRKWQLQVCNRNSCCKLLFVQSISSVLTHFIFFSSSLFLIYCPNNFSEQIEIKKKNQIVLWHHFVEHFAENVTWAIFESSRHAHHSLFWNSHRHSTYPLVTFLKTKSIYRRMFYLLLCENALNTRLRRVGLFWLKLSVPYPELFNQFPKLFPSELKVLSVVRDHNVSCVGA